MEISRPELIAGRKAELIREVLPSDALCDSAGHPASLFCRYCQKEITQQEIDDGEVERLSDINPEDVAHRRCIDQDQEWKERGGV